MNRQREWTDDREGGSSDIHKEETECCKDGACKWRGNTSAQSEEGGGYRDKAV
ncbi:MAG: hypothetical protein R3267_04225 [Paenisporosarcina sp.]|nr:hypothetical protein [Paenisporosarcina sp.]